MGNVRLLVALLVGLFTAACSGGAPVIDAVNVDRQAVVTGGRVTISVDVSDPDGDALTYTWTADVGQLSASDGAGPVVWTAPAERGAAKLKVKVSDGSDEVEGTVTVSILGWVEDPTVASLPEPNAPFNAVAFVGPDEGWAVGGDEGGIDIPFIAHYKDGAWTDETSGATGHLHGLAAVAKDDVWAGGSAGLAFHWDGASWEGFTIPGGCLHGMTFAGPNDGWVTPAHGQGGMRHYGGGALTNWETFPVTNQGISGVSMIDGSSGWAVGPSGTMFSFDGSAWTPQDGPVTTALNAVHMIGADDGWAVGSQGVALHYDGNAWTAVDTGSQAELLAVHAVDSANVWAVGAGGAVLFYDGAGWLQVDSGVTADLHGVFAIDEGDAWIVGHGGTILHLE